MRTGRPRKPTLTLIREGKQVRGRDHAREPQPIGGLGKPPAWFTAAQRHAWRELAATLPEGVLTRADREICVRWCVLSVRWHELEQDLRLEGLIVPGDKGRVRNPKALLQVQAATELDRIGSALGLSPAARTRIELQVKPKDQDPAYLRLIGAVD